MKYLTLLITSLCLVTACTTTQSSKSGQSSTDQTDDDNKLLVAKDGTIELYADPQKNHQIFGYAKPDTASQKIMLFSIFTDDVKDNPKSMEKGAYYGTNDMEGETLKYVGKENGFIKATLIDSNSSTISVSIYFKENQVAFE